MKQPSSSKAPPYPPCLPSTIPTLFTSSSPESKPKALSLLHSFLLQTSSLPPSVIPDIYFYLKTQLTHFKDPTPSTLIIKSFPILKHLFTLSTSVHTVIITDFISSFYTKLTDNKLTNHIKDIFTFIITQCTHLSFIDVVFKRLQNEKQSSLIMAYLTFFRDVLSSLPNLNSVNTTSKSFIDVGLHFLMNNAVSHSQIKQNAVEYLTELYRHIGTTLRNALIGKKAYLNVQVVQKLEKAFDVVDKEMKQRGNRSKRKFTSIEGDDDDIGDVDGELGFQYTVKKYNVKKNKSERSYRGKSKDNSNHSNNDDVFKITVTPIKKKGNVNKYQQQFITTECDEQQQQQQRKHTITPDNINTRGRHHLTIPNNNNNNNNILLNDDIDHIYIPYNNYYDLKKTRNADDLQSNTTFISIKNHPIYGNISLHYLSSFLSEQFIINKLSKFTSFTYEIRFFIKLIQDSPNTHTPLSSSHNNTFRLYFYPNYDLILKYIITKSHQQHEHAHSLYEHLYNFFHTFYKQLKLNDLLLDVVETDLTLQTLFELLKQLKNETLFTPMYNLIKLYINLAYTHTPYALVVDYAMRRNSVFTVQVVLEMFKENLQNGNIDTNMYNVVNYMKCFAKVATCRNVKVKQTLKEIFNVFKATLNNEELKRVISGRLTMQEQKRVNEIIDVCDEGELFYSEIQVDDDSCRSSRSRSGGNVNVNVNVSYNKDDNSSDDNIYNETIIPSATATTTIAVRRRVKGYNGNSNSNNSNATTIRSNINSNNNNRSHSTDIHSNTHTNSNINPSNNNIIMHLLQLITQTTDITSKQHHLTTLLTTLSSSSSPNTYNNKHKRHIKPCIPLLIQTILTETETFFYINPTYTNNILRLASIFTSTPKLLALLYQSTIYDLILLFIKYMKHNDTSLSHNADANYEKVSELLSNIIDNSEHTQALLLFMDIAVNEKDNCDYGVQAVNCLMQIANQMKTKDVNVKAVLSKIIEITSKIKKNNVKEYENVIKGLKYVVFELVDMRKRDIYKDYDDIVKEVLHKEENNVKRWINNFLSGNI